MTAQLRILALESADGTVFEGEVDIYTASIFENAVFRALSSATPPTLTLDFRRVPYLDAAGARVLAQVITAAEKRGIRVAVRPSVQVDRILRLLKFEERCDLLPAGPPTSRR